MSASDAGNNEPSQAFRARLQGFRTMDEFIRGFNRYVSSNALLLPTSSPRDVGSPIHVLLEIASGDVALGCRGVVHNHKTGPDGRPMAMTIRIESFDEGFQATFDRMLDAKRERTGAHATVPATPPAQPDPGDATPAADTSAFPLRSAPPAAAPSGPAAAPSADSAFSARAPSPSSEPAPSTPSEAEDVEDGDGDAEAAPAGPPAGNEPEPSDASEPSAAPAPSEPAVEATSTPEAESAAAAPAAPAWTPPAPAARPAWLPAAAAPAADESLGDEDVDALWDAFDDTFDSIISDTPDDEAGFGPRMSAAVDDAPSAPVQADEDARDAAPAARTMMGIAPVGLEDIRAAQRARQAETPDADDPAPTPDAATPDRAADAAPTPARTMIGLPALDLAAAARASAASAPPSLDDALERTPPPDLSGGQGPSDSQPLAQLQFKKVSRSELDGAATGIDASVHGDIVERNTAEARNADAASSPGPVRPRTAAMLAALTDDNPAIPADDDAPDALEALAARDRDDEPASPGNGLSALDALVGDARPAPPPDAPEAPLAPLTNELTPVKAPEGFFARIVAFFRRLFGGKG